MHISWTWAAVPHRFEGIPKVHMCIWSFGLIAWTGNDVLNRRLTFLAESEGSQLDYTGLFPATHSPGGKWGKRASWSLKLNTEKEVFDFLGFPWLEPHERNLWAVNSLYKHAVHRIYHAWFCTIINWKLPNSYVGRENFFGMLFL